MGTRLHKKLGWGFDNIIENDPRFKYNLEDGELDAYLESRKEEFSDYLRSCYRNLRKGKSESIRGDFSYFLHNLFSTDKEDKEVNLNFFKKNLFTYYDSVAYPNSEYGLPNVFLLQPVAPVYGKEDTYSRFDDNLDCYELQFSTPSDEVYEPVVLTGRWSNIYPYCSFNDAGSISNIDDLLKTDDKGRPVFRMNDKIFDAIREINSKLEANKEFLINTDLLKEASGKNYSYKEYKEFVYPDIPETILRFLWFMDIFVDPRDNLRLKPLVYRYWS